MLSPDKHTNTRSIWSLQKMKAKHRKRTTGSMVRNLMTWLSPFESATTQMLARQRRLDHFSLVWAMNKEARVGRRSVHGQTRLASDRTRESRVIRRARGTSVKMPTVALRAYPKFLQKRKKQKKQGEFTLLLYGYESACALLSPRLLVPLQGIPSPAPGDGGRFEFPTEVAGKPLNAACTQDQAFHIP